MTASVTDERSSTSGAKVRLLLVKASLVLILVGMLIVGKRNGIWPVITWPMYARQFEMPEPVVSRVRVDVVLADGRRVPFMLREIAPVGEHEIVAAIIQCTQTEEDPAIRARCIGAIDALARRVAPERAVAAIEVWEVRWNADVLARPPLDRERPDAQRLIGRIDPQDEPEGNAR